MGGWVRGGGVRGWAGGHLVRLERGAVRRACGEGVETHHGIESEGVDVYAASLGVGLDETTAVRGCKGV